VEGHAVVQAVFVEDEGAHRDVVFSEGVGVAPHGVDEVTETHEVGVGPEAAVIVAGVVEEVGRSVGMAGVASLRSIRTLRYVHLQLGIGLPPPGPRLASKFRLWPQKSTERSFTLKTFYIQGISAAGNLQRTPCAWPEWYKLVR